MTYLMTASCADQWLLSWSRGASCIRASTVAPSHAAQQTMLTRHETERSAICDISTRQRRKHQRRKSLTGEKLCRKMKWQSYQKQRRRASMEMYIISIVWHLCELMAEETVLWYIIKWQSNKRETSWRKIRRRFVLPVLYGARKYIAWAKRRTEKAVPPNSRKQKWS